MVGIEHILAVVVLYNTNYRESATIASINAALEFCDAYLDVLIYDNSSSTEERRQKFTYKRLNIHYIHDGTNAGVSHAYNTGALYAHEQTGKKWILLLDQDTLFAPDLFVKYKEAIDSNPGLKLFAPVLMLSDDIIFSPCKYYFKRGFPLKKVTPGVSTFNKISPVNSGMLLDLQLFFEAGMYNSLVKLDFSDFDFIERVRKLQSNFYIIDTIGVQDFSNNETDIRKLNIRYSYFCEGAKNCFKAGLWDRFQYLLVAFLRAVTLSYRNRSLIFYKTFFNSYLKH